MREETVRCENPRLSRRKEGGESERDFRSIFNISTRSNSARQRQQRHVFIYARSLFGKRVRPRQTKEAAAKGLMLAMLAYCGSKLVRARRSFECERSGERDGWERGSGWKLRAARFVAKSQAKTTPKYKVYTKTKQKSNKIKTNTYQNLSKP